jgi:hypothetical protein
MASSSKEGLGISDISNLLDSNEMIDTLLDSDDIEFSDTDKNSHTDFIEQEDDVVLLDIGDNSIIGDTACVSDSGFLWEDMDNYAGQREMYSGIIGPQDSRLML